MDKPSLLDQTRLDKFILASFILHLLVIISQGLLPARVSTQENPPPIKVRYIDSKNSDAELDKGSIVDAPKPRKIEKPRTSELLAKHDSRAHSNKKKKTTKKYKRKKTVAPKARGTPNAMKMNSTPAKKNTPKPSTQAKAVEEPKPLPLLDNIGRQPVEKVQPAEEKSSASAGSGGALSLLDGFDAAKYASLDTDSSSLEESDDDEPVSLDTTETKYASYFARIKHQIERVWSYPLDAARKGLSGELTISFKISKDGNLLGVQRVATSGHEILDLAAVKAVKEAAPFYPFPLTIKKDKLSILATFIYTPAYDTVEK
ncbi:MAG: TonB family protein [Nitrospinaceae bacterium]